MQQSNSKNNTNIMRKHGTSAHLTCRISYHDRGILLQCGISAEYFYSVEDVSTTDKKEYQK